MKREQTAPEFAWMLERAMNNRSGEVVELRNATCEVCGDKIRRYIGTENGIICHDCIEINREMFYCGTLDSAPRGGDQDYEPPDTL